MASVVPTPINIVLSEKINLSDSFYTPDWYRHLYGLYPVNGMPWENSGKGLQGVRQYAFLNRVNGWRIYYDDDRYDNYGEIRHVITAFVMDSRWGSVPKDVRLGCWDMKTMELLDTSDAIEDGSFRSKAWSYYYRFIYSGDREIFLTSI